MKNTIKLFGFLSLAAVLILSFVNCDSSSGGGGGSTSLSSTYTGNSSDGTTYKLVVTAAPSAGIAAYNQKTDGSFKAAPISYAPYNPKTGDSYELTITPENLKSAGTVVSADGGFELKPTGAGDDETFSVIVEGGVMVAIGGKIKLVDSIFTEVFVSFITHTGTAITGDDPSGYMIGNDVDVVYAPSLDAGNLDVAKAGLTFEYVLSLRDNPPTGDVMADAIIGENVTIELSPYPNPKATLKAGAPKPEFRQPLKQIFPDVLYFPKEHDDVEYFGTEDQPIIFATIMKGPDNEGRYTADEKTIGLACARDNAHVAGIVYVDKDVIMKGAKIEDHGGLSIFDADLKKGWNFVFFTFTGANKQNILFTASKSLPPNYKWTVADHNYFDN